MFRLSSPALFPVSACLLVLTLSGCSTASHRFKVEAIAASQPGPPAAQYTIVSAMQGVSTTDPRFQQVAGEVRFALNQRGMVEAVDPADADIEVAIDYGLGANRTLTKETPDTAYAMGTMETVYGTVSTPAGTALTRQSVYLPTQTLDATRVETVSYTEKQLNVTARETRNAARGAQPREVWLVQVSSQEPDADLGEIAPLMATAAGEYLGTNTDGRQEVVVHGPNAR